MSRYISRRTSIQRCGATTVELAIIAPFYFLLIFGVVEFGRAMMVKHSLTEAARAGARCAALATTIETGTAESAVQTYLRQTMTDSFNLNLCRISISPGELESLEPGSEVTARVELDFNHVTWIVPSFMNGTVIGGEASMTKE